MTSFTTEYLNNIFYEKQNYDIALLKTNYSRTIYNSYNELINYFNILKYTFIEKIINNQCLIDNIKNIDAFRVIVLNNDYDNNFKKDDIVIVLMLSNNINMCIMPNDDKQIIKNIYNDIGDIHFVIDKYNFTSTEKNILIYIPFSINFIKSDSMFEHYNILYNTIYTQYYILNQPINYYFNIKYPRYLKTLYYDSSSDESDYSDLEDEFDNNYFEDSENSDTNNQEDTVITL